MLACMLLHSMARREAKDAPAAPNTIISSVYAQCVSGAIGLRQPAAISVAPSIHSHLTCPHTAAMQP